MQPAEYINLDLAYYNTKPAKLSKVLEESEISI